MGITIHYKGKAKSLEAIDGLIEELKKSFKIFQNKMKFQKILHDIRVLMVNSPFALQYYPGIFSFNHLIFSNNLSNSIRA
jgi:hypothetical protein